MKIKNSNAAKEYAMKRIGNQCSIWVVKVQGRGSKITICHKLTENEITWNNHRSEWDTDVLEHKICNAPEIMVIPTEDDLGREMDERNALLTSLSGQVKLMETAIKQSNVEEIDDIFSQLEDNVRELYRKNRTVNDIAELVKPKKKI